MSRVTVKKPNYKKFGPTTTDKDGYMILPENRNKYKKFSDKVASLITERLALNK